MINLVYVVLFLVVVYGAYKYLMNTARDEEREDAGERLNGIYQNMRETFEPPLRTDPILLRVKVHEPIQGKKYKGNEVTLKTIEAEPYFADGSPAGREFEKLSDTERKDLLVAELIKMEEYELVAELRDAKPAKKGETSLTEEDLKKMFKEKWSGSSRD